MGRRQGEEEEEGTEEERGEEGKKVGEVVEGMKPRPKHTRPNSTHSPQQGPRRPLESQSPGSRFSFYLGWQDRHGFRHGRTGRGASRDKMVKNLHQLRPPTLTVVMGLNPNKC